jgi:chemotaxis protein CheC
MFDLTDLQQDAIAEVINIAVGRAASALNQMVGGEEIILRVPELDFIDRDEAIRRLRIDTKGLPTHAVRQDFSGLISGNILLIFPEGASLSLVRHILRDTTPLESMTELEQEALVEVGNVLLNACLGSIADMLGCPIESSLPIYLQTGVDGLLRKETCSSSSSSPQEIVMFIHVSFSINKHDISGYLAYVMDIVSATAFKDAVVATISAPLETIDTAGNPY